MKSPAMPYSFDIVCPCGCDQGFIIECASLPHDLEKSGNAIWECFVGENGLEKSIEILHSRVDEDEDEEGED